MPAGAAWPDRRIPGSFAGLGSLPEREIAGAVFIVFVYVDAGAVEHAAEIALGELAVLGKFGDAEIVGAVIGPVGEVFGEELGNELRHLGNVLCRADQR